MRSVDLAVYADALAAEAATLSSRLERARRRLGQAAIEHEARQALPAETVRTLEQLGVLPASRATVPADPSEIDDSCAALAAVQRLQAWVEEELRARQPARTHKAGSDKRPKRRRERRRRREEVPVALLD